jgi:hypothetical protein
MNSLIRLLRPRADVFHGLQDLIHYLGSEDRDPLLRAGNRGDSKYGLNL